MTWIIGTPSIYGVAILLSDICVTFEYADGSRVYRDCLQKIYYLGNYAVGGFSGSVNLGLQIIDAVKKEGVKRHGNAPWDMNNAFTTWLPDTARCVYEKADKAEKNLGSELIIGSADPVKNRGIMPWPWTDIHILSAPQFKPLFLKAGEVKSIGSGSDVPIFTEELEKIQNNASLQQSALQNPEFLALIMVDIIRDLVTKSEQKGISKFVQVGLVTRGSVRIENVEYKDATGNGTDTITRTPTVARGLKEFNEIRRRQGRSEKKACC